MAREPEEPRYRVLAKSFINNGIVEEGAEVVFHGEPGENLEPLNDAAVKAKTERTVTFKAKASKPKPATDDLD